MYIKAHIGHALCKRAFQQSVCIVLYKCSIISFRTAPGAARQSFVHRMAWPAGWREERTQPFHPQYRTKFPLPIATRSASNPTLMHMYPVFVQCQKERARASQPAKYANPPNSSYTHPQPSSSSSSSSQSHSFFIQLRLKSLTSHPHPSAHASSTACSSCSTPPCTSPCSWCSRSIRPGTRRSRGSGCSGRSSVR
jgi:hypothetical protein